MSINKHIEDFGHLWFLLLTQNNYMNLGGKNLIDSNKSLPSLSIVCKYNLFVLIILLFYCFSEIR